MNEPDPLVFNAMLRAAEALPPLMHLVRSTLAFGGNHPEVHARAEALLTGLRQLNDQLEALP